MTASGESPSERAESAARKLSAKTTQTPLVALVLGSGLSGVVDSMQPQVSTSTAELLGAPSASVTGHSGKVILGTLTGVPLIE
jgi:hypothetical protein